MPTPPLRNSGSGGRHRIHSVRGVARGAYSPPLWLPRVLLPFFCSPLSSCSAFPLNYHGYSQCLCRCANNARAGPLARSLEQNDDDESPMLDLNLGDIVTVRGFVRKYREQHQINAVHIRMSIALLYYLCAVHVQARRSTPTRRCCSGWRPCRRARCTWAHTT